MIILEFKGYFLEMQTSDSEKNLIREIISNLISYNKPWFDEKCILVGDKTNYWILNYSNFGKNEYNRLVRGMVIKKPTMPFHGDPLILISSFPFFYQILFTSTLAWLFGLNNLFCALP